MQGVYGWVGPFDLIVCSFLIAVEFLFRQVLCFILPAISVSYGGFKCRLLNAVNAAWPYITFKT